MSPLGSYDVTTHSADLQLAGQAVLARLLEALPQPDVSVVSGTRSSRAVQQQEKTQSLNGRVLLGDFTGGWGRTNFAASARQRTLRWV